jgi:aminoglycoside phosphotransferase (APT) family kinase protein
VSAGPAVSDLPDDVRAWVEAATGSAVVRAARHLAGASRQAWAIDTADGAALFLMRDSVSAGGGSARDAAVARALAATAVPVPGVVGDDPALGVVLMARVDGRSDFPAVDHEREREPTARHLMEVAAALHHIDPADVHAPHLGAPGAPGDHARRSLADLEGTAAASGAARDPLLAGALDWLRHDPPASDRTSLVHSDLGPGNFLARGGRVTALLDWEVAHFGDPMEDLAALAIRDMATPVGDLPTRFGEYEVAAGTPVDLDRVRYYRVLILARNTMLLDLGLDRLDASMDGAQLTMYRALLHRALGLALCDAVGTARPELAEALPAGEPDLDRIGRLATATAGQLRDLVVPAVGDGLAATRASGAAAVVEHLALVRVLGSAVAAADARDALVWDARRGGRVDAACAAALARHGLRAAALARPLLGPLADRLPQPLVHP